MFVVTVIPLGGLSTSLSDTSVWHLRLDYLLHALVFLPLVPLWKLTKPHHPLWLIVALGAIVAAAAELSHCWIPYRGFNINDLAGNILGAVMGTPLYFFVKSVFPNLHRS